MALVPSSEAEDQAAALHAAAAANPELQRLLAERDLLMQRIEEIAERSPGAFAGRDQARFPVEPLGERRARDTRWAQARDESRSDAIRRILDTRRRDAAAKADQWPELRERQRIQAAADMRLEREAAEAQARALDERIEQARQDLLAERWAARAPEPGEDWHALRERQAAELLAEARARSAAAAEREQALERRIARDRAGRQDEWSDRREGRRALALELARRQAVEAAAAEQALDRRLARAREESLRENRAAHDPERAPEWVAPSDRRGPDPLPPEPARPLPPTAAERSLDERIERARADLRRESRAARSVERALQSAPTPDRRSADTLPAEPARPLPPTAAERPPDDRIVRAREADPGPAERRPRPREADDRQNRAKAEPAGRARRRGAEARPHPAPREEERPRTPAASRRDESEARFLARRDDPTRDSRQAPPAEPRPRPPGPMRLAQPPQLRAQLRPAESFEERQDRQREARSQAQRQERRAERLTAVARGIERVAVPVRKLDSSLDRVGRGLRDVGVDDETLRRVDQVRGASAKLSAAAGRAERVAGRDALRAWEERRERVRFRQPRPAELGGFRRAAERKLGMATGSVDERTDSADAARERRPDANKPEAEKAPVRKTAAERLSDLDKRCEQALERLKARRRGERGEERRGMLSRGRLSSMTDRFSGGEG